MAFSLGSGFIFKNPNLTWPLHSSLNMDTLFNSIIHIMLVFENLKYKIFPFFFIFFAFSQCPSDVLKVSQGNSKANKESQVLNISSLQDGPNNSHNTPTWITPHIIRDYKVHSLIRLASNFDTQGGLDLIRPSRMELKRLNSTWGLQSHPKSKLESNPSY